MLRSFRFAIAAALAVAVAPSARAADVDKLLPADAEYVIHFNLKQILDSDIIKKYALDQIKQALQGNDAQAMLKELGLDPLKDITKITIGASGTDQNDAKALILVRGAFDPDKLFKAAEAQSKKDGDRFTMIKDGKDTMFKFQPDNGNPMYATVLDKETVAVATDKKIITTASAAAAEKKASAVSKELSGLISRMDDKASMWVAAITKDKLSKLPIPKKGGGADIQAQLGKMDSVTVVLRVTGDINLEVGLGMANDAAADEMGKMVDEGLTTIKGALPFLLMNQPQAAPLGDVAKSLKSEVKGKTVSITAKMAGSVIGELMKGVKD
jgi:hypothetical protein